MLWCRTVNRSLLDSRVQRKFAIVAATLLIAAAGSIELRAQTVEARDSVELKSGKTLRGRVVRMTAEELTLRIGSRDRTIARDKVRSVNSVAVEQRKVLSAWRDASVDDVPVLLAIARHADKVGLPHEARLMRWYAVLQRPNDEAIHAALGNRKRKHGFQVQIDRRWVPLDQADALGKDFGKAWQLRSEHFSIRCAAGLRVALDTLMELEHLYWTMHDLFGSELALFELVEPIEVRLYRTRKQMPNLSNNVGAYFDPGGPALYTCFENGRPFALMHEATHALLHFFFVRAAQSRGTLPAWLDEGWAEYMDGRMRTRVRGKPTARDASTNAGHFQTLARAEANKDLYRVHRLLNFKASDFQASTGQSIKYAQAWALFRYLLEQRDPTLRALFFDYLREAAAGKGQASTFRKLFKRFDKQIEQEAPRLHIVAGAPDNGTRRRCDGDAPHPSSRTAIRTVDQDRQRKWALAGGCVV